MILYNLRYINFIISKKNKKSKFNNQFYLLDLLNTNNLTKINVIGTAIIADIE